MASAVSKVSGDLKSSSFDRVREAPPPPPDSSLLLATRPPRQAVSYWTCSKLCAFCFVAGAVFGYSLRGRVKRWASKMLKKLS
ncbi:hypothetical protein AAZX31_13G096000 [Glycine max]|uniref:Uncharacterized protein n=2 Tax=Glycine subgen. Soja TaxID=1462606 RepID=C6TFN9_SOYBN|nr:uncharacterized protein LOC100807395 isoform X2 [Glycine max]XP_028195634.1 uncharacterized protein LOC114380785 isoform X2 [Glycine soja]ACU20641.1 unknown [Glycine max]KAH1100922.1 hypothetical protein GYH30_035857 [Glycine max]RZB71981.1 hypothetical protein D0Y65_036383 [Glycine soja]|eukprot:XP_003542377.1 uncharacterized protein LOC100807395 isoform X2 [Glycine max]